MVNDPRHWRGRSKSRDSHRTPLVDPNRTNGRQSEEGSQSQNHSRSRSRSRSSNGGVSRSRRPLPSGDPKGRAHSPSVRLQRDVAPSPLHSAGGNRGRGSPTLPGSVFHPPPRYQPEEDGFEMQSYRRGPGLEDGQSTLTAPEATPALEARRTRLLLRKSIPRIVGGAVGTAVVVGCGYAIYALDEKARSW